MRILITGASGQLGTELQRIFAAETLVLADLPEFDLRNGNVEARVIDAKPDVVIHTGAYTDVDGAELDPALAIAINADGTERVARGAAKVGARLLYISTDYVFDGLKKSPYMENDPTNPLSVYGKSKLEGERRAVAHCPNALVVRTSWLYGAHGKNFVKTMMRLTMEQPELRVVADQRGCPTNAADLAQAVAKMLTLDIRGIVHATGTGECTWHEFACAIVSAMGAQTPVLPITTAEAGRRAPRPSYSVLENSVLKEFGITLSHWRTTLVQFVNEQCPHASTQA